MKKLATIIILLVCVVMEGCITVQVKSDKEILAFPRMGLEIASGVIKDEYPGKVEKFIELSDKVLNADTDELFEFQFKKWVNGLSSSIDNAILRNTAKAILNSFEVKPTGDIDFDMGSLRTAKEMVRIFRDQLKAI